jgi:hypothetical protein
MLDDARMLEARPVNHAILTGEPYGWMERIRSLVVNGITRLNVPSIDTLHVACVRLIAPPSIHQSLVPAKTLLL